MDKKVIIRENIKFMVKCGDSREEVLNKIKRVYGKESPCQATIYTWYSFFVRGGQSAEDSPRPGRPRNPVNPRLMVNILNLIKEDPKISTSMIALLTGETKDYICNTLRRRSDLKYVLARWVPKLLSTVQKSARVKFCNQIVKEYGDDWAALEDNLLTVDETWVYFEPQENQRSSGSWQTPDQRPPEVGRIGLSSKKVMCTIFWNRLGVVHMDFLANGKAINKEYYNELLKIVYSKLSIRRRRNVIFLQDNAPSHKAKLNMDLIKSFGWKCLPHPPYSPDLSPSDYYLFKLMKNELFKSRFVDTTEAETEVSAYFDTKSKNWFKHGIELYKDQINNCIVNKGEY